MTQIARDPAYLRIEDRLDAIAQRYRLLRIVRGAMLFGAGAIASTVVAALAAHFIGQATANWVVLGAWVLWLAGSFILWMVIPMVVQPRMAQVARLVEGRLAGLHNGLTNSVLLAQAPDLQASPWLPAIFEEIAAGIDRQPLQQAIRFSDLRPLAIKLLCVVGPMLLAGLLLSDRVAHGWRQMIHPTRFVLQKGAASIVAVQPGNVTLVTGQALEIGILAQAPDLPTARLIFDNRPEAALTPSVVSESERAATDAAASAMHTLRYGFRLDRVEQPMRYRVEVGGTQGEWYTVKVVRQVKLTKLTLRVSPPPYTRRPVDVIALKADQIDKTPVTVLQGSRVEVAATVDVPVGGAMLQVADEPPSSMARGQQGLAFTGAVVVMDEIPLSVLLTEGAGQIIARLPEPSLLVRCTKDAPPTIEMKWPTGDTAAPLDAELKIAAVLRDDLGLATARVLMAVGSEQLLEKVYEEPLAGGTVKELSVVLPVKPEHRKHAQSVRVQVEAVDNRHIPPAATGPGAQALAAQTTSSSIYEIRFRDAAAVVAQQKEQIDVLRGQLLAMLKLQQALHGEAVAWKPTAGKGPMQRIGSGQTELRGLMQRCAEGNHFGEETRVVQKTLLVLVHNPAREAIELAGAVTTEPLAKEQARLCGELQGRQKRVITVLESLLAMLRAMPEPTTQPLAREGGDLPNRKEAFEKLNEALKEFIKEQQRLLDQAAPLVKKPVDDYTDKDKKLLEELKLGQEKLDAFMKEKVNDTSKLAEQDHSNASLLKEMMEVYSEVTMAKDALKDKAVEIAVAAEELGLEAAKEIQSNLEKWLMDKPDRLKWTQEDLLGKNDPPMAELPKELEDMVGELMEQQEDLFEDIEDTNANLHDSIDKGAGWDAMDGPIANMTAKGVTGNQLPNNNEMDGRSGQGRTGKSSGEMVEETANDKGGRNTPTRLDPTPFAQGQVKDESKDPVGGATGGGKLSGQGGAGLEGPVGPKLKEEMKRLAQKQAEIRNSAERLNLKYQLGRYDMFKLLEATALMRRVESDLKANRYQTSLRRKDVMLQDMETSRLLLSGRLHVQRDTTPAGSQRLQDQINDAMKGQLPSAWQEALKEYYRKLATE